MFVILTVSCLSLTLEYKLTSFAVNGDDNVDLILTLDFGIWIVVSNYTPLTKRDLCTISGDQKISK